MAAPTNAANVKKVLVNSEPSTHGTNRKCQNGINDVRFLRVIRTESARCELFLF
jgi:hypothetical protein